MGNADPQQRCHSRLDQSGSGGSRTRGTERAWRVVAKGRRSLLCLALRYTEIIARQHVFAPCSSATRSRFGCNIVRHAASPPFPSTLEPCSTPSDSETDAWRHRDRSCARGVCAAHYRARQPPVSPFAPVGALCVRRTTHWATHDDLTAVQKAAHNCKSWLDHCRRNCRQDRPRSTGRDRGLSQGFTQRHNDGWLLANGNARLR